VWNFIKGRYTTHDLKAQWRWELVFILFFLFMLEIRFINPTISYAEKFMDHAFLASVMRDPVVPPIDPWFAGGFIDIYYYLGYWMFGCLGIVSAVPSNIAFNLALPTVYGVSAVTLYAIGDLLLERFRWLPVLTLLLPNMAFFYQTITGITVNPAYDPSLTWLGTRVITNTINEYPLFSFVWGDVHPHVVGIFNQLFLIFILAYTYRKWVAVSGHVRWVLCMLAAISLGSMPALNTWDVLIYAPIVLLFGVLIWWQNRSLLGTWGAAQFLLAVPPIAVACYVPFYFRLKASTGGLALVTMPSDPVQFLFVHGFFIVLFCLLLAKEMAQRPYLLLIAVPFAFAGYPAVALSVIPAIYLIIKRPPDVPQILGILGFILIIITEFVYLKDNMGDIYFRMNTVFKVYNVAWLLLSISLFTMAGSALSASGRIPVFSKEQQRAALLTVILILIIVPLTVPLDLNYGSRSLDGLAYLGKTHPGDAAAVVWLRALSPSNDTRIVEAVGGDYTYYSRISSFTGIPTILGEPFHEIMWRGEGGSWYGERMDDVQAIYEQPEKTRALMEKYDVTYLVLGDPEREKYNVSGVSTDLTLVFSKDGTEIYRLDG
jgi:YYY domain-containing protein